MTGFAHTWLDLREPADAQARNGSLLRAAITALGSPPGRVLDLGCGTGATWRAFRDAGATGLRWHLVDHDPALLDAARARLPADSGLSLLRQDLRDVEALPLAGTGLVTASALFDLASAHWIEALCTRLARRQVPLYAALTYDGTAAWAPPHPLDAAVLAAFNAHQRGDKGFGPALGPLATDVLATALKNLGYQVRRAASPWRLGAAHTTLIRETARGMAHAAAGAGLDEADAARWLDARTRGGGTDSCVVGHYDLVAIPPKLQSKTKSVPRS